VTDPAFEALYLQVLKEGDARAKETCLKCHAPIARATKDFNLTQEISREGVTCDFCHTISAVNMKNRDDPYTLSPGKMKRGPYRKAASPAHQTMYSKVHETSELCGGCHEYEGKSGTLIMGTYSEWKNSPYAAKGVQCQDCHMPTVKEARTVVSGVKPSTRKVNKHDLQGGHSLEQLRQAMKVEIADVQKIQDRLKVTVNLTNIGSGHMVPTGIPSRRLTLIVKIKNPQGEVVRQDVVHYQKVLVDEQWRTLDGDLNLLLKAANILSDNRIAPKETRRQEFFFSLPEGMGKKQFLVPQKGDFIVEAELHYHYSPLILQKTDISVEMAKDIRAVPK